MAVPLPYPPVLLLALFLAAPALASPGTCTCSISTEVVSIPGLFKKKEACNIVKQNCGMVDDQCNQGYKCNSNNGCTAEITKKETTRVNSKFFSVCIGKCGASFGCTKIPGGRGDPHMTGFDQSRFDFHGVHGRHYVFFGRQGGDLLVAKMRQSSLYSKHGIAKTFFDQFGLQLTGSARRVVLAFVKETSRGKPRWVPDVRVDDVRVEKNFTEEGLSVRFDKKQKSVSIDTKETSFSFHAMSLMSKSRHWDVFVSVSKLVERGMYLGVLGVTLNKKLGVQLHPDLDNTDRSRTKKETAMRSRFEVDSLLPDGIGNVDRLSGVVRTLQTVVRSHQPTGHNLLKLEAKARS